MELLPGYSLEPIEVLCSVIRIGHLKLMLQPPFCCKNLAERFTSWYITSYLTPYITAFTMQVDAVVDTASPQRSISLISSIMGAIAA